MCGLSITVWIATSMGFTFKMCFFYGPLVGTQKGSSDYSCYISAAVQYDDICFFEDLRGLRTLYTITVWEGRMSVSVMGDEGG